MVSLGLHKGTSAVTDEGRDSEQTLLGVFRPD